MDEPTSASPPASHPQGLEDLMPHEPMEGVDESTWMDVIQKMDEVYSQLIHDEMTLDGTPYGVRRNRIGSGPRALVGVKITVSSLISA